MPYAHAVRAEEPIGQLNTTPLIDVLLVLLVMFILSIPAANHSLPIDLPVPARVDPPPLITPENTIAIDRAGTISWNGETLSEAGLAQALALAARMNPEPLIRFEPQGDAPYAESLRVLNIVKASDPAAFAIAGNERYADFGKPELTVRGGR